MSEREDRDLGPKSPFNQLLVKFNQKSRPLLCSLLVRALTRLLVPEEPNDEREEFEFEVPLESQVFDEALELCDWELSEIRSDSAGELTLQIKFKIN